MRNFILTFLFMGAACLNAAPRGTLEQQVMELQHALGTMRYAIDNRDAESSVLQERLLTQEQVIEQIREDMAIVKREATEKQSQSLDKLDCNLGNLIADLKQVKNHANDMSESLAKAQTRIGQLEGTIQAQNRNIANLQSAINSILEAFDMKPVAATEKAVDDSRVYVVKSGDSLEKIARKHNIAISKLKEINGLSKDVIRVGQKLKLCAD